MIRVLLKLWKMSADITRLPSKAKAQMGSGQGNHCLIEVCVQRWSLTKLTTLLIAKKITIKIK